MGARTPFIIFLLALKQKDPPSGHSFAPGREKSELTLLSCATVPRLAADETNPQ
jgi:hypothetical protein